MDKNQNAVTIFNKLANEYQSKFMDVNLYSESLNFYCNTIKKDNAHILELACGPGNITNFLLSQRPDFEILGIDLAPNMLKLAKINNPKASFQQMDCRDINSIEKKYDGIVCGFLLPYLSKLEAMKLISDASNLLTANGLLYLSFMEDDYCTSGIKKGSTGEEIFMHFHQADYITDSLKENDFKILKLERKTSLLQDETETTDLLIIASK